jgi:hypothetical protein
MNKGTNISSRSSIMRRISVLEADAQLPVATWEEVEQALSRAVLRAYKRFTSLYGLEAWLYLSDEEEGQLPMLTRRLEWRLATLRNDNEKQRRQDEALLARWERSQGMEKTMPECGAEQWTYSMLLALKAEKERTGEKTLEIYERFEPRAKAVLNLD